MGEASVTLSSGETPLAPRLPLRLGRFTLCEELGAGGMATVYLARMELAAGLERLVALKTIHPHLAKEKAFVDMFLDEARIASHVTHPNVCSTHDFGELDSVYYLAMEYLLGEPLFDVINRMVERFDDLKEVLPFLSARIIADACEGVHAAHAARGPDGERLHIVHRDVSPQNLFITYDGAVKVVDFGCAKAAERVAHTSTGVMKGKVGYAAPEQIKSKPVDARADVWALGVCLWESLALSPLFSRETAVSTAMAVLEDPIELASDGRDWVPVEVAKIANKALQRDVDGRYASARDLGRDLRKFIADSGFTLESAELAEWMDFLFDDRHEEKIRLAQRVQELDISNLDAIPLYEVTDADVEVLEGETAPLVAQLIGDDDSFGDVSGAVRKAAPAPEPEAPPALPKKSRGWLWVLLTIAAIAVGGFFLHRYYEPAPWFLDLIGAERAPTDGTSDSDPSATDDGVTAEGEDGASEEGAVGAVTEGQAADGEAADGESGETADGEIADGETADGEGGDTEGGDTEGGDTESAAADGETAPADGETSTPADNEGSSRRRRRRGNTVTTVVSGGNGSNSASGTQSPATPRVATGSIRVVAHGGWADVWVGGRRLGRTPVQAELPEGRHQLRIMPWGREPAVTETVNVEAALEQTIPIEVGPQPTP